MNENKSMGTLIKELLKDLLRSKKFVALLTGLIINLAVLVSSKIGVSEEMAKDVATKITGLVASYIIGQGVADVSKEAKKIEASNSSVDPTKV